ncbi:hypothetical protein HYFRA_00007322 [Hymenoscyphus fraxineus]|uniref:C2H2-type domain-containing protein n=1 Tax=Hymenoscyphus fraxineus TaxID=746836 RepID=A0A9N9KSW2_9HELO|nr:hypothetical protein HYFRA_00007322 [Hymenoscyphus fraxineus]
MASSHFVRRGSMEPISPIRTAPSEPSVSDQKLGAQKVFYEPGFVDHNGEWRKTFEVGFYDNKGVWVSVEPKDSFNFHPRIPITLETIQAYAAMRGTIGKHRAPLYCDRLHCALYQNPSRFVNQDPVLVSVPFYGQGEADLDEEMAEPDPEKIYFWDPLQQPDPLPSQELIPQHPESPRTSKRRPLHGGPVGNLSYSEWKKLYPIGGLNPHWQPAQRPVYPSREDWAGVGQVNDLTDEALIELGREKQCQDAGWIKINGKWVDPDDWGQVMAASVPDDCTDPSVPKYVPPILPHQFYPRNEREVPYFEFLDWLYDLTQPDDVAQRLGSSLYAGPKLSEAEEKERYPDLFGLRNVSAQNEVDKQIGCYFTDEQKRKYPVLFGYGLFNPDDPRRPTEEEREKFRNLFASPIPRIAEVTEEEEDEMYRHYFTFDSADPENPTEDEPEEHGADFSRFDARPELPTPEEMEIYRNLFTSNSQGREVTTEEETGEYRASSTPFDANPELSTNEGMGTYHNLSTSYDPQDLEVATEEDTENHQALLAYSFSPQKPELPTEGEAEKHRYIPTRPSTPEGVASLTEEEKEQYSHLFDDYPDPQEPELPTKVEAERHRGISTPLSFEGVASFTEEEKEQYSHLFDNYPATQEPALPTEGETEKYRPSTPEGVASLTEEEKEQYSHLFDDYPDPQEPELPTKVEAEKYRPSTPEGAPHLTEEEKEHYSHLFDAYPSPGTEIPPAPKLETATAPSEQDPKAKLQPSVPLICSICPQQFSDVSELLTHLSSESHLANRFELQNRARSEPAAKKALEDFERSFFDVNLPNLLSEQLAIKEQNGAAKESEDKLASGPEVVGGNIAPATHKEETKKSLTLRDRYNAANDIIPATKTKTATPPPKQEDPKPETYPATTFHMICTICPHNPQFHEVHEFAAHVTLQCHQAEVSKLTILAQTSLAAKVKLEEFETWYCGFIVPTFSPRMLPSEREAMQKHADSFFPANPQDDVFGGSAGAGVQASPSGDPPLNIIDEWTKLMAAQAKGKKAPPNPATDLPKVAPVPRGKDFEIEPAVIARWAEGLSSYKPVFVAEKSDMNEDLNSQEKPRPQDEEEVFYPGEKGPIKVPDDHPDEYMSDSYSIPETPKLIRNPPGVLDLESLPKMFQYSYPLQYQDFLRQGFRTETGIPRYPNYSFGTASMPETFTEERIIDYFATDGGTREQAKARMYETQAYIQYLRQRNAKHQQDRLDLKDQVGIATAHECHARYALDLAKESLKNFLFDTERQKAELKNAQEGIYRESVEGLTRLAEADQTALERYESILEEVEHLAGETLERPRVDLKLKISAIQDEQGKEHVYNVAQRDWITATKTLPPRVEPLHVTYGSGYFKLDHPAKKQYRRHFRDEVERVELEIARFEEECVNANLEKLKFQHAIREARVRMHYLQRFIENVHLELMNIHMDLGDD